MEIIDTRTRNFITKIRKLLMKDNNIKLIEIKKNYIVLYLWGFQL